MRARPLRPCFHCSTAPAAALPYAKSSKPSRPPRVCSFDDANCPASRENVERETLAPLEQRHRSFQHQLGEVLRLLVLEPILFRFVLLVEEQFIGVGPRAVGNKFQAARLAPCLAHELPQDRFDFGFGSVPRGPVRDNDERHGSGSPDPACSGSLTHPRPKYVIAGIVRPPASGTVMHVGKEHVHPRVGLCLRCHARAETFRRSAGRGASRSRSMKLRTEPKSSSRSTTSITFSTSV